MEDFLKALEGLQAQLSVKTEAHYVDGGRRHRMVTACEGLQRLLRAEGKDTPANEQTLPSGQPPKVSSRPKTRSSVTKREKTTKKNHKGETALHSKCVAGDLDEVKALLATGADPNTVDHAGWTPLHEAVCNSSHGIVKALLEAGALPEIPGMDNITPLHEAARNNNHEIVTMLIEYGASAHARDRKGVTPMDVANDDLKSIMSNLKVTKNKQRNELLQNLADKECKLIHAFASQLDAKHSTKLFSLSKSHDSLTVHPSLQKSVTHVIVEKNNARATRDTLRACVSGKWIILADWVDDSDDNNLKDIDQFTVTCIGGAQNGVSLSRMNRYLRLPKLFDGCHFYIYGLTSKYEISLCLSIDKAYLTQLITDGGGIVLKREPDPEAIPDQEKAVPYHASAEGALSHCSHFILFGQPPLIVYNMKHLKALPVGWLVECIQNASLIDP